MYVLRDLARAITIEARSMTRPKRRTCTHIKVSCNLGVLATVAIANLITVEPVKRGGKPCVRGLRITAYDVLEYLAPEGPKRKSSRTSPTSPEKTFGPVYLLRRIVSDGSSSSPRREAAVRSEPVVPAPTRSTHYCASTWPICISSSVMRMPRSWCCRDERYLPNRIHDPTGGDESQATSQKKKPLFPEAFEVGRVGVEPTTR